MHKNIFKMYKKTFGERLKGLREEKKMNQQQLADHMGNKTVISSWELNKSKPSMDDCEKLSELFGVTIDYLVKGIEVANNVVNEPPANYMLITKDEFISLLRKTVTEQNEVIEKQSKTIADLKNPEMVVDKAQLTQQ
jgi:transcriptional regulator with XRE-family HTH domain